VVVGITRYTPGVKVTWTYTSGTDRNGEFRMTSFLLMSDLLLHLALNPSHRGIDELVGELVFARLYPHYRQSDIYIEGVRESAIVEYMFSFDATLSM